MTRVQPKATPNWCPQVKPDEPWTGRCMKEKIAADGKRHRCHKPEKHTDNVHACECRVEWKQFYFDSACQQPSSRRALPPETEDGGPSASGPRARSWARFWRRAGFRAAP